MCICSVQKLVIASDEAVYTAVSLQTCSQPLLNMSLLIYVVSSCQQAITNNYMKIVFYFLFSHGDELSGSYI